MSGNYPAQILKENVVRWIKTSPLDVKDTVPPKVIDDASRTPKHQKQWWKAKKHVPTCANSEIFTFLTMVILAGQNPIFSPRVRGEKLKFWGAIVGTGAQICMLGLEPYLLIWIHPRRSKWLENPQDEESRKERMEGWSLRRLSFLDWTNTGQASTQAT